jgi:molecular chaperone DnaK (HSP70)
MLERLRIPCEALMAQTGWTSEELYAVEVVGGTSRIPAVKEMLKTAFKHELSFTLNAYACFSCAYAVCRDLTMMSF